MHPSAFDREDSAMYIGSRVGISRGLFICYNMPTQEGFDLEASVTRVGHVAG